MRVAGFFGAGLPREDCREGRVAVCKAIESGDYVVEGFEVVHAVGAAAEFAGSLRSAEQQDTDDGDFAAIEIEDFLQAVFEFCDAAVGAAGGTGHAFFLQASESVADCGFVEGHHRVAVVFLIAGVDQGVERERVVVGRGDVFFDQGAEDAGFEFGEDEGHGSSENFCCDLSAGVGGQECPPHPHIRSKSPLCREVRDKGGAPARAF